MLTFHEAVKRHLSFFITFAWYSVKFFSSIDSGLSSAQYSFVVAVVTLILLICSFWSSVEISLAHTALYVLHNSPVPRFCVWRWITALWVSSVICFC